jgi:(p)ppGpp synthase/HD superfamily hydrolase
MKELVREAKKFAIEAHTGKIRPNRVREPCSIHLQEVAELIEEVGGSEIEIAAGWLHDAVEDTKVTIEEIRAKLGNEVADIVDGLTDPKWPEGISTLDRKKLQAVHVKSESKSIKLCKLADQISNLHSVAVDPPIKWTAQKCRDYTEGAKLIAIECRGINLLLDKYFAEAYEKAINSKWLA